MTHQTVGTDALRGDMRTMLDKVEHGGAVLAVSRHGRTAAMLVPVSVWEAVKGHVTLADQPGPVAPQTGKEAAL